MAQRRNPAFLFGYRLYVAAFFLFLAAPLVAAGTFAFNDSLFPALPWQGFTLDWFFNDTEPKLGMFHDRLENRFKEPADNPGTMTLPHEMT